MINLNENNLKNLKILPSKTKNLLEALSKKSFIKNFYLAGGTALVLGFAHRVSNDLDFFSEQKFNNNSLKKEIKKIGKWEAGVEIENTLIGYLDGIKSSFFYLPYKLIEEPRYFNNLRIAGLADIALMKILAISQRAAKRDFVDLDTILSSDIITLHVPLNLKGIDKTYHLFDKVFDVYPVKFFISVLLIIFASIDLIPYFGKLQFGKNKLPIGGALSGFFGGLSGNQGALRSAFLIKAGLSKEAFIGTAVVVSTFVDFNCWSR